MAATGNRVPHFRVPLDLAHAATVAARIRHLLARVADSANPAQHRVLETARALLELLEPYWAAGENPPRPEAERVAEEAAHLGRDLVDGIERLRLGSDRLGQCVRNLFELLERGEEGAIISLRAGENPNSLQRPV